MVEMLVIISLLAIIITFVIGDANKQRIRARDNIRVADIDMIRLAIEEYRLACGEYPKSIILTTNNGCDTKGNGKKLSDFLPRIPAGVARAKPSLIDPALSGNKKIAGTLNYYYTGLSNTSGASSRCYDYRIAAELELASSNGENRSPFLDRDHDELKNTAPYTSPCRGTTNDFGSTNAAQDDDKGLYDFRSTNF